MKLLWMIGAAAAALPLSVAVAAPDHCPPTRAAVTKAAYKPAKHHHRKHRKEPRYYEEEYAPAPPPPPPPAPRRHVWHDGYGKAYDMGPRPWGPPPPCPCPPDHDGGLPDVCKFNVWFGYDHHWGLESGL